MRPPSFRDLPLFAKLLVPFFALLLVVGASGAYLVVRDLAGRARAQLNQELLVHSLNARTRIHDRELYVLESADFAANLEAMAPAVRAGDAASAATLLQSVLALKTDLNLLAVARPDGGALVEFLRRAPSDQVERTSGRRLNGGGLVSAALEHGTAARAGGLVAIGDETFLAIATPICSQRDPCSPAGVALAGMRLDGLVVEASREATSGQPTVAIYDTARRRVAASGPVPETSPPAPDSTELVRRNGRLDGRDVASVFAPLEVQGSRIGQLSVTILAGPSLAAASGAGLRLALLLFAAMSGVVAIGWLLSRYVTAQVRPLVKTSRALGSGDLAARVPVVSRDELGELAGVLNQMAEQLQASHETLERTVEERTQAIRELLAERTDFFTGLSHELRTPVAIILSHARMMLDPSYGTSRVRKEGTDTIVRSAEQLLARINQILELARMEAGRIDVEIEDVSVPEVIEDLHSTMAGLATANGLTLRVDVPRGLPPARADRARLGDVLLNLVSNAVKYTPHGGSVKVAASARNGSVKLAVTDTGIGIPGDVGDRVFEPFYQVPGSRAHGGQASSGLGLALARRLVEAQGGTIEYTSAPEEGSTFTVALTAVARRSRRSEGT